MHGRVFWHSRRQGSSPCPRTPPFPRAPPPHRRGDRLDGWCRSEGADSRSRSRSSASTLLLSRPTAARRSLCVAPAGRHPHAGRGAGIASSTPARRDGQLPRPDGGRRIRPVRARLGVTTAHRRSGRGHRYRTPYPNGRVLAARTPPPHASGRRPAAPLLPPSPACSTLPRTADGAHSLPGPRSTRRSPGAPGAWVVLAV